MALKKNPKGKRREAEVACEHYCLKKMDCIITRRAIKTQWQSVDFFGSDVVGKRADGSHVYVQVTAGQSKAVNERKKKLEAFPWHKTDTVQLLQLVQTPDPANARRTKYFFRVYDYANIERSTMPQIESILERQWRTREVAIDVPGEWFRSPYSKKVSAGGTDDNDKG